jgi:hypothetical protein
MMTAFSVAVERRTLRTCTKVSEAEESAHYKSDQIIIVIEHGFRSASSICYSTGRVVTMNRVFTFERGKPYRT